MKASNGRLSPFKSVADDDGLDVLFFDKKTGNSVAIQLKCRTKTDSGGNTAQFDVREATYREERRAFVVAALLNEKMTEFVCSWFIPMKEVKRVGNKKSNKYVIAPSKAEGTFRHSLGTNLRSLGVDIKTAQELLRHANSRTTLDIYTQAVPATKRKASAKVVKLLLPLGVRNEPEHHSAPPVSKKVEIASLNA